MGISPVLIASINAVCAVSIGALRSRAGVQQHLHHRGVGQLDGFGERRGAELIGDVHFRLLRDQRVEQFVVYVVDGPVHGACAVGLRLIHIRAGSNLVERRLAVAGFNEIGEGILLRLCENGRRSRGYTTDGENETFHGLLPNSRASYRSFTVAAQKGIFQ